MKKMDRRKFLQISAAGGVTLAGSQGIFAEKQGSRKELWMSPAGDDQAEGTQGHPLATPMGARDRIRSLRGRSQFASITVRLMPGTYYLRDTLLLEAADSNVLWEAAGAGVVFSGGDRIASGWMPYRNGIWKTQVPQGSAFEELFVNGERQVLARYPNFDPRIANFNGFSADATSQERVARWANPEGGYLHALHKEAWGGLSYRITGKKPDGTLALEGGWQTNRPASAHLEKRYVENIFEELDAPAEWFLDRKTSTLFYYPLPGVDLNSALVEASRLKHVVELRGALDAPVRGIEFRGVTFRHTARTFMQTRETLLRTDWAIYRGGAVVFAGTEDCGLQRCFIDQPGGNGVFVDGYNRRTFVRRTRIDRAGASSLSFMGKTSAVRNASADFSVDHPLDTLDLTRGPKTEEYPADGVVEDCLLTSNGRFEKQSAGVEIDIAARITVRSVTISGSPRSGINIGDGCFGGHDVDRCDVFDTVLETGDHGSFNSWGRDRFWVSDHEELNRRVKARPGIQWLDVLEPIRLHDSRWRCDHGWDIDLDDGSSNYRIYNNLCLKGGIKLREGFGRMCTNNVLLGHGFDLHAWPEGDGTVIERNILPAAEYGTALMYPKPWGKSFDDNFANLGCPTRPSTELQAQSGRDVNSLDGDAMFVDAEAGDYRVKPGSPALKLGFVNFPMNQFGVRSPELRALAGAPSMPEKAIPSASVDEGQTLEWHGSTVRNIRDEREMSAYGLSNLDGAVVVSVLQASPLAIAGLKAGDVILKVDGRAIRGAKGLPQGDAKDLVVFRGQAEIKIVLPGK